MPELLLELLSEEIPARMQARAAEDLKRLTTARLKDAGLTFSEAHAFITPRRLALVVEGLPERQPDSVEEKKGPRLDAPDKAIQGFLKGNNLASIDEAEERETDKGSFYFLVKTIKGRQTFELIDDIVNAVLKDFSWPKSMRWGEHRHLRWVRPLRSILCLFDGPQTGGSFVPALNEAIPFTESTRGHRFLAPEKITVENFSDYKAKLEAAKVMLDPAERRAAILKQAKQKAARAKLTVKDDPALLDEVTGLVEWPVVLMGRIDEAFMDLPPEVLTTAMRTHQKYLALTDATGRTANRFLVVANSETADRGKTIIAGNERVLRARLADARFFWDQDRKVPLSSRTPALGDIVFHAKLGSLDEKVDRVQALAVEIANHIAGADKDRVRSAARLAKADLVTGMVGEFPELQGIMGRYYALHDGEHAEVADAIAEHYAPQGPNDACPSAPVSVALALADKIDTLTGFFRIDEKPTGSKDPYALRRAALGVIRLIVENRVRLPLRPALEAAKALVDRTLLRRDHVASLSKTVPGWGEIDRDVLAVLDFFADRLKVALRDRGVRHDLISAVFALGGEDDLVRLLARVGALEQFLATDDGANLLVAFQRAANIVRIEEKRDKTAYQGAELDSERLVEDEERILAIRIFDSEAEAKEALAGEDFTGAMTGLAKLRRPVDQFFDRVTVNTEDPQLRANRLRLLARIGETLGQVADFSRIEG